MDVFDDMRARKVPLSEAAFVSVIRAKALGGAPEVGGWVDECLCGDVVVFHGMALEGDAVAHPSLSLPPNRKNRRRRA